MSKLSMFDRFPNELFYEVFEYLTTYDILYAFKGLNKQIDTLLRKYDKYNLKFKSCPKSKFDFICQSIGPEQVQSLILSDSDDTCRQIHLFFGLFYIRQFINLETLILIETTEQDLNKIATKLHLLPKLSCLSINLIHGSIPKIIGPSLKYLSISTCSMSQLEQLLLNAPLLTNLNVQLKADPILSSKTIITDICQLKIKLAEKSHITFNDIKILLIWMPKIEKLTFTATKGRTFIHGDQWEYLIRTYLPELKEFHFAIHPHLDNIIIQQMLSTFQTPFWLKEKQWFIHCNHHEFLNMNLHVIDHVHLYTLPYINEPFYLNLSSRRITTTNVSKDEYSTIKNLDFSIDCQYNPIIIKHYYFPNLDSLTIRNLHKLIPLDNLINLSQIKHLTIQQSNPINSQEFFLSILIHCTQLQSLELSWYTLVEITRNFTNEQICLLLTKQIKYLNLTSNDDNRKSIEILNRIFSINLEKLSLSVISMDNIVLVLNEMFKLYSVKFECNLSNIMMNNEELLRWFRRNIPRLKNSTYQIRSITETRICLVFWIGH